MARRKGTVRIENAQRGVGVGRLGLVFTTEEGTHEHVEALAGDYGGGGFSGSLRGMRV